MDADTRSYLPTAQGSMVFRTEVFRAETVMNMQRYEWCLKERHSLLSDCDDLCFSQAILFGP
jgi:hypothetical protein